MGYQAQPGDGGGGGIPAGAAVMSDDFSVEFNVAAPDVIPAQIDIATFGIEVAFSDIVAGQVETAEFGVSGFTDTVGVQGDNQTTLATRWATAVATGGTTAPTNPTNALGENNGTVATCKAGGLANGTSILTLTIAAPLTGAGANPTFTAYYQDTLTATIDSAVQTVSYRQIGQGSNTVINMTLGGYLTTPYTLTLTNIDASFSVIVSFNHLSTTPAAGGSIVVDAVGIQSTGVL